MAEGGEGELRRRVVVVDDDAVYVRAMQRALRSQPIDLIALTAGRAAIAEITARDADLVVMDVRMPDIDGVTACREIKSARATPIVLVSGNMSGEVRRAAHDAGADHTLSKPYDLVGLIAAHARGALVAPPASPRAAELLTGEHLAAACQIARALGRRYDSLLSPEDIDGLAYLGLCEAASRYDPTRDEAFLIFALPRIRGAVMDAVRKRGGESRAVYRRKREISGAQRALASRGGDPSDTEISALLGITPGQLARSRRAAPRQAALDSLEQLPSPTASPHTELLAHEARERLALAREVLEPTEQRVIELRYLGEQTFPAIAVELGLPETRVMQIHTRALQRLRDLLAGFMAGVASRRVG